MSHVYKLSDYGRMMADTVRTDAYMQAMQAAIKPGSVVIDLGSGPGLFSILACRMGARRVYAIESADVIQIAREAAAANGFADRIQFFHDLSTLVTLPERADVIVSDLRGPLPYYEALIPSIRDARERLLKPGGVLIPERDRLSASIVEIPGKFEELVNPWSQNKYGVDFTPALDLVTNSWIKSHFEASQLLAEPVCFHTLDYYQIENPNLSASFTLSINKSGTAHGLGVWFDSELFEDINLTNRPGYTELLWGNSLFFFPRAIEVSTGDRFELNLSAHLHGDYIWSWTTRIYGNQDKKTIKADFRQSTFLGTPVLPEQIKRRTASHRPKLNENGQIDRFILSEMNGSTPLDSIAGKLIESFPDRFNNRDAALRYVTDLSSRYSE